MTHLYSCRHSGDQYRITKFDTDMNVESSYLCDLHACDCPAGVRPSCRHRDMLPKFLQRNAVGSTWLFDFDRGGWVQLELGELKEEPAGEELSTRPQDEPFALPPGVVMLDLSDPGAVHNAIADAVGEPRLPLRRKGF